MDTTEEQSKIGRWLGIAHRVGSDMTYWILTESGKVIARSTVQHITTTDKATDAMKTRLAILDDYLVTRLDDENFQLALPNHMLYLQDKDAVPEHRSWNTGTCYKTPSPRPITLSMIHSISILVLNSQSI